MAVRKRSAQQIREGWYAFLRVLARNSKLKFVIGHPSTNGKVISLPPMPAELTNDDLVMFKSDALHEVGHVLYSDFPFYKAFNLEHGKMAGFLLNVLDDVFMERKSVRFNRMAEGLFRKSAKIMYERKQFRDGSANAAEAFSCYCLTYLFGSKWSEYRAAHEVIEGNFDTFFGEHAENLKSNLNEILDREFPNVLSTPDAGKLTLRILAMLEAQSQCEEEDQSDEEDEDPQDDGDQDQSGNQDDDQDQGESQDDDQDQGEAQGNESGNQGKDKSYPKGDDAESGEGEGSDKSGKSDGDDSNSGDAGAEDERTEGGSDDQTQSSGSGKTLKEIVQEMLGTDLGDQEVFDKSKAMQLLSEEIQHGQSADYSEAELVSDLEISGVVESSSDDIKPDGKPSHGAGKTPIFVDGMPVCDSNREEAQAMLQRVDRKANVLAAKLQSLLLNREEAEVFASRRGQLGTKNLYRIRLDDTRVFEQKEEVLRPTAAVSVCADLSASTAWVPVPGLVCKCCGESHHVLVGMSDMAFCNACGGKFEVDRNDHKETPAAVAIQQALLLLEKVLDQLGTPREFIGFAPKTGGTLNTMIRTFGDAHNTAVNRIGGLSTQVGGHSTPIGEAVMQASMRLQAHGSHKKVLFVLTDGDPSCVEKALQMTDLAQRGGVKVVYLLIGTNVRCDWLKAANIPFAHAKTADDLCPILLDQVGSLLV